MVYTLGETVLDIIYKGFDDVKIRPGGSMLNTAVSLGRLGVAVSHISTLAVDKSSDILIDFLHTNGVGTDFMYRNSNIKTSLALAVLNDDNNADYTFYKDELSEEPQLVFPEIKSGDVIHFGSFFCLNKNVRPQLINFLKDAKNNGAYLVYDPNFRKPHLHHLQELLPMIEQNFELADIVKASNEDLQIIFEINTSKVAWIKMKSFGVKVLIYTKGADGAEYVSDEIDFEKNANNINVKSTVGAGDTFSAGIVYYLINHGFSKLVNGDENTANELLSLANDFSGEVCQSFDNYLSINYAKQYINV